MERVDALLQRTFYRLGVSGNCTIAAVVLMIIHFYPENEALKIAPLAFLEHNKAYVILYIIGVLISAAYIVWRKPFLTAEVKHSKCNFCGAQMETIELRCTKCQSDATKNRGQN
jgi:hypothetical protein